MRERALWVTLAAIFIACLPTLVFRYLPMTDLPQHMAMVSVLDHYGDPAYGFAANYSIDWTHTPYVLPYALAIAFGKILPAWLAMHVVVFASAIAYPLGLLALLRAANKPPWLALLAVPFVYDRAFFWGFINFNLSIGLAIAAFAIYVDAKKTVARDVVQALLVLAATFTHVYGLALACALVGLYALLGGFRVLRARPWTLAPLVVGIALWAVSSREQAGYGIGIDPPFFTRVRELPDQVLGGYQDFSELAVLAVFVAAWLALAWPALPVTRARIAALAPVERIAYLAFAGNLVLYFVLPQATWTAKFIHFRHAFLALSLLPIAARAAPRFLPRALAALAAGAAILNSWGHLFLFDREAQSFDQVARLLPQAPKIAYLDLDPNGAVSATFPYLHFVAYLQAEHGGMISMTFPAFFWNLPVQLAATPAAPKSPENLEWAPRFDEKAFGYYYDWVLVRIHDKRVNPASAVFPFEPVLVAPPWQLYRRQK